MSAMMKTIFLVQQDEADRARRIERLLFSLSEESGILFVGVSVIPDPLSPSTVRKVLYRTVIGCSRARDPKLIELVVKTYLRDEVDNESQLVIEVHRGVDRTSVESA